MVLVAMIDDATSKVVARFHPAETTEGYMDLLGRYLRKQGRMLSTIPRRLFAAILERTRRLRPGEHRQLPAARLGRKASES